jgi:hypothetical protein
MDNNDLKIIKDLYGLSGAEISLVKSGISSMEADMGRQMSLILDADRIDHYLVVLGIKQAEIDLNKVIQEYGKQLIWEGTEFSNKQRLESGKAILERFHLGSRERKEGD